ncbi:MAG TPA: VWA domain-containing protein [Aggregatilineales bacterium]|nr:VWA domain-containing protein [Aggregatilineales bacterium]
MNFLAPGFLALAAIAVPIILLYMLRLRRREVTVSSNMLWQRLMQDREANAPWQRLRRNLLLFLQLLILAALVFALARPYLPVPSVASGSVALLLDASASMNSTDMPGGASRFEAAQEQARALVADLAGGEVMTVIAAGPTPQVLTPPTADRAVLRDAINRAEPTRAPADWPAALTVAAASVAGREDATIVVVSDGGLPADLPPLPGEVRYVPVGRATDNLAISALAVRPLEGEPQLFASIDNYGPADAEVILSLEVDGELATAERLTVPAGGTATHTIDDLPAEPHAIRAQLTLPAGGEGTDYLAADDTAYAVYAPPVGGRVLLVSEGNLFLEQVLTALPAVEAFRAEPGALPEGQFDLVIFDGWLPAELPATNLLIVDPPQSTDIFTVGETFSDTRLLRQADDPILAFVDFGGVAIREAAAVQTPGWGRALVEARGGPLLLAGTTGGRRVAVLTFDLHESDLPLQVAFPILMANLLEWYEPGLPFEAAGTLRPGEPVIIRPQATTDAYAVTAPDGARQVFAVETESPAFTRTTQPGVYTVELLSGGEATVSGQFAVNLFSPAESDITPASVITVGETAVEAVGQGDEMGQYELWPWLAVLALAVLFVEWWVYHRGAALRRRELEDRAAPRRRLLYFGRRQ